MPLFTINSITTPSTTGPTAASLSSLFEDNFENSILQYPNDLASTSGSGNWKPHVVKFFINANDNSKYGIGSGAYGITVNTVTPGSGEPPVSTQQTIGGINITQSQSRVVGSISLYMPNTMNMDYNLGYSDMNLSDDKLIKFGELGISSGDAIEKFYSSNNNNIQSLFSGKASDLINAFLSAGLIGEGVAGAGLKGLGVAINPQVQLMFNAVELRTFDMDFTFSPRDQGEAQIVKNIIQTFKFHAAPEITGLTTGTTQGLYFVVPSTFNIQFLFNGQENPYLNRFNQCVLTNVSVNYAPNGDWATFYDGSPTQTTLTLRFKETDIIDKDLIAQGY
jgi:hypothetical protein